MRNSSLRNEGTIKYSSNVAIETMRLLNHMWPCVARPSSSPTSASCRISSERFPLQHSGAFCDKSSHGNESEELWIWLDLKCHYQGDLNLSVKLYKETSVGRLPNTAVFWSPATKHMPWYQTMAGFIQYQDREEKDLWNNGCFQIARPGNITSENHLGIIEVRRFSNQLRKGLMLQASLFVWLSWISERHHHGHRTNNTI